MAVPSVVALGSSARARLLRTLIPCLDPALPAGRCGSPDVRQHCAGGRSPGRKEENARVACLPGHASWDHAADAVTAQMSTEGTPSILDQPPPALSEGVVWRLPHWSVPAHSLPILCRRCCCPGVRRAYSLELREKIVESVKEGLPKRETAVSAFTGQRSSVTATNSMSTLPRSRGKLPARNPSWTGRRRSNPDEPPGSALWPMPLRPV